MSSRVSRSAKARETRLRSRTHLRETLERPAKIARAYELRIEGLSEREIAVKLGCSKAAAHVYVTEALAKGMEEIRERGREYVHLELERLEFAGKHLRRRVSRGDTDAAREWRALSESRRKLLGLDSRPDADTGAPEIHVTFKFPDSAPAANAGVRAAAGVAGPGPDAGRPASVPVDRDGHEDR